MNTNSILTLTMAGVALAAAACTPADRADSLQTDSAQGFVVTDANWMRDWARDSVRTDAEIFGALHQVNVAEIEAARYAQQRASDSAVREFATWMIEEHQAMDSAATSLARQLGIAPAPTRMLLEDAHQMEIDKLERAAMDTSYGVTTGRTTGRIAGDTTGMGMAATGTTAAGSMMWTNFDRLYIDQQIRAHRHALDLIAHAADQTENETVERTLRDMDRPRVERHLQRAEEIQSRIGRPAADTTMGTVR